MATIAARPAPSRRGGTARYILRTWHVLLIITALLALYLGALWPWMMRWGASDEELAMALPGDELVPDVGVQSTRAVTVGAPADEVWRWVVQIGQDRGGFYSLDWMENLFLSGIHNADQIRPEWQQRAVGDLVRGTQPGFLGGALGEGLGWRVPLVEPGRTLYLWGPITVVPVDAHSSRLLIRTRMGQMSLVERGLMAVVFDPPHFVMERGLLLGVKQRAEGQAGAPGALALASALGWAAAALAVLVFLAARPRGRLGLLAPTALFFLVIGATWDVRAATAGFLMLGISIAGFVAFGRGWWRWYALLAALVLLTLLLAPDPHLAFGLMFLAAAAAGAAWLARQRSRARVSAAS